MEITDENGEEEDKEFFVVIEVLPYNKKKILGKAVENVSIKWNK